MSAATEIRTNWLTKAICDCREIERFFPKAERRAETRCIIRRIQDAGREGKQFLCKGEKLRNAIEAGLLAAEEHESKDRSQVGPTAASVAMLKICDELEIDPETLSYCEL
jgi:hypothetical protein